MTKHTICVLCLVAIAAAARAGDDSRAILTIDHYLTVRSAAPAIAGERVPIYVRERVMAGTVLRGDIPADRVVLFVHGAGTPGSVAFDVPREGYSWMADLAAAGFDVFSVDLTGYGRSVRPAPMNDPCNFAEDRQAPFIAALMPAPCPASYPYAITTLASDWADIAAAMAYIRDLRGVERVSLVAWSLGGPRAGGYAAAHPEQVHRLVLLAPAYARGSRSEPPALPAPGTAMNPQSRSDFMTNWERQVQCEGQLDAAAADAVWAAMLDSDPVGATWGPGVRRAPQTTTWGWNAAVVSATRTPALLVAPVHDAQVSPERVRELYEDYGSDQKVLLDLGCASHNAMWEGNRDVLFRATRDWLERGTVNGTASGTLSLGY